MKSQSGSLMTAQFLLLHRRRLETFGSGFQFKNTSCSCFNQLRYIFRRLNLNSEGSRRCFKAGSRFFGVFLNMLRF